MKTYSQLNRSGPLPLYFQLKEALLEEIRTERLVPGDQLPTEQDIERRYGISRTTIRQALNELLMEGIIERVQGKGTFIAVPKIHGVGALTSFTENMLNQGHLPAHRLLDSYVAEPPTQVASTLELEPKEQCRFLRRLFLADDRIVGLAETWMPLRVLGEHDALFEAGQPGGGSLYQMLQLPPLSIAMGRAVERITSRLADDVQAAYLGCVPGAASLLVDRVTYDIEERPFESTRMVFLGEDYEYRIEMYRPSQSISTNSKLVPAWSC